MRELGGEARTAAEDPFEILRAGVWVVVAVDPERKVQLKVERIVRSPATIWCHSKPAAAAPDVTLDARPMTMFLGQLQIPIVPASSAVTERPEGNVLTASFRVLPGTVRVQRRGFVRMRNPQVDVRIRAVGDADAPFEAVKTQNLGGGGLAVEATSSDLDVGDGVEVQIGLAGVTLPARGVICRAQAQGGMTLLGVQFTEIQEAHRDRIVSYIFREQAKTRARK